MNNTIPFHSATHAPQITVDVNILTMLKQAASCLTEAAGKDVYLAAIGPDMELTIIMEEDAPSVLPCFDEDDVGRNGMACCPFHNDKTPSMKLDRRYHCFGCGADGDVIDFAAALYGLGKKEAAVQLAQDFGLSYEDWKPPGKAKKPKPRQKSPEEQFQEAKNRCFRILADYLHLLRAWRKEYAPHSPEEAFHPRFVEALQKQDQVEYLLDVLLFGETEEKAALITDYGKDVIQLEQRMAELAAADAARTKKHHERHAAAPER